MKIKLLILILLFFPNTVFAVGAYAGIDNFDSYSNGALHLENGGSGWAAAWSGSINYVVTTDSVFKGDKAVQIATDSGSISRLLSSTVDSGDLYYAISTNDETKDGLQIEIQDGATLGGAVSFEHDAVSKYQIRISSHAEADVMQDLVADTWYIININFVSSTQFKVRAKVAGGSFNAYSADLTYINSVTEPDTIDWTAFGAGSAGTVTIYFDEIGTTDPDPVVAEVEEVSNSQGYLIGI